MWEGESLHWAIARFLGEVRDDRVVTGDSILAELKTKMQREWQFSEQKTFRSQPMLIDKGGLGLVEHEYGNMPAEMNANIAFTETANAFRKFLVWLDETGVSDKVRSADNIWIEPPVFGPEAPGFTLSGVQIITKVDLALEKSGEFFEIYDWKSGEPVASNGPAIGQNDLQVCVYQLWPHMSMQLPLSNISSRLVYLGGEKAEVRVSQLDEKSVPMVLLMIQNSVALADRWAKNFAGGLLKVDDLDYASWAGSCRDCQFKGICRESLKI